MFWESLKSFFGWGHKRAEDDSSLTVRWLRPEENPWKVQMLDIRGFTQSVISTSSNPDCARNAISYGNEDGSSFLGREPISPDVYPVNLRYRTNGYLSDGVLFVPKVMEHKWAIFLRDGKMIFVRSWTREVAAIAEVHVADDLVHVTSFRGDLGAMSTQDGLAERSLDALIRIHVLDVPHPIPLPAHLFEKPDDVAMICFSMMGNLATIATPATIPCNVPEELFGSHPLLHIATARGDKVAVDEQIRRGVPVTLLGRDGLSALHWALAADGRTMIDHLLAAGVPIDIRSRMGATPLMSAAQERDLGLVKYLLDRGADVNAGDDRGFTALHRAAEMGVTDVVRLLLERGAIPDPQTGEHTPRTLAELRGEAEIMRILDEASGSE